jgi:hypothetical protein
VMTLFPGTSWSGSRSCPERQKALRRLLLLQEGLPLRRGRGEGDPRPAGNLIRVVAWVNPGSAAAAAPARPGERLSKSVELDGYTDEQILAMIEACVMPNTRKSTNSNRRSSPSSAPGAPTPGRPRRHQPDAVPSQRPGAQVPLHGTDRPGLHPAGVPERGGRRPRLRLPPRRLPLHGRQLPRPAAVRRLPVLLDFVGVDPQRLQFSGPAAEGANGPRW